MNNFEKAARYFAFLQALAGDAARSAAGDMAARALGAAKAACPVRSGRLKNSLLVRREGERAAVVAGAPYAGVVEKKHPFLRPSLNDAECLNAAQNALRKAVL